jgi:hypothetical protein
MAETLLRRVNIFFDGGTRRYFYGALENLNFIDDHRAGQDKLKSKKVKEGPKKPPGQFDE